MSVWNCFFRMKDYLKEQGLDRKIPDARLREFARMIEDAGGDSLNKAQFESKLQQLVDDDVKRTGDKIRAAKAYMLATRESAVKNILDNTAQWIKDLATGKKAPFLSPFVKETEMAAEAFRVWLQGGALRSGVGTNVSVALSRVENLENFSRTFKQALDRVPGLREAAESGKLDKPMFQALDAIDRGIEFKAKDATEQLAHEYAKAIKELRDEIYRAKASGNPFLEKASDYLLKQFHDSDRIRNVGKVQWVTDAMKAFGELSFPGKTMLEKTAIFADIYDRIVDGTWGGADQDFGSSNHFGDIWRQQAKARQLVASDWSASYEYFSKYGPETAYDGLHRTMGRAATDIAMTDKFGPIPNAMYEAVFKRVLQSLDGEAKTHFENRKGIFDEYYRIVKGSQIAPAESQLARNARGALTLTYLAHAGAAVLRSIQDPAIAGSLARDFNGKTIFENSADIMAAFAKSFANIEDARKAMSAVGVYLKAAHMDLLSDLGTHEKPGKIAKLGEAMGNLSLMQRRTDAMRAGVGTYWAHMLADESPKSYASLSDRQKQFLARYDIQAPHWEAIRQSLGHINDTPVITPENIRALPDDVAEKFLRDSGQHTGENSPSQRLLDKGRYQLSNRVGVMINEMADLGSAHMDTRQRSALWGDSNLNSWKGVAWRLVTQFKSAAVVANDVMRRSYFSGDGPKGSYSGMMQYAVSALFLATAGEYVKQFLEGKTPESFNPAENPAFALKMMAMSGAAGIWGDNLLSELDRGDTTSRGLSLAKGLLGPIPGAAIDTASLALQPAAEFAGLAKPDKHLGSKIANTAISQIPFQNLFWAKSGLNYALFNSIRNWAGPGYLDHLQQRTEQTAGLFGKQQQYFLDKAKPTATLGSDLFGGR